MSRTAKGSKGSFFMVNYRGGSSRGNKDGEYEKNADFGKAPGEVDFNYSGDPNKLVNKPFLDNRGFFDKLFGAQNTAELLNREILGNVSLREALQPLIKKELETEKNIEFEAKRKEEEYGNTQLAKGIIDMLAQNQQMSRIPTNLGGDLAGVGNFLKQNFGPIISREGGAVAFPKADEEIAVANAGKASAINSQIASEASRPTLARIAEGTGHRQANEASIGADFSASPEFRRMMEYSLASKMVPPVEAGPQQTIFDRVGGKMYTGARTEVGETVKQVPILDPVTGKVLGYSPETLRTSSHIPGGIENVVGMIQTPNPAPPEQGNRSPRTAGEALQDEQGFLLPTDTFPSPRRRRRARSLIDQY